ncbi:FAD-dependent oxidoreductase [Oleiharenicola lentus]|uniref:FAD-dependent oxidoreductase n=1 Tax=Oleiharenicola lentus TaxID=2508720 RepID=UPI003F662B7A
MRKSKSVIICGGGVVGLCCAYYLAREGYRVTLIERGPEGADSCAHGSAGYISPSHVIPLAQPGMVWKGLKWMTNPRSPFYIKPRLDGELIRWSWLFARAATKKHVLRSAPVLRDLCVGGRELFVELADITGNAFEFKTEGLVNLCKTQKMLDHEAHALVPLCRELGIEARILNAQETQALEPDTKIDVLGSVYFPIDAHITPRKFVPVMVALLKEMGVDFKWNTTLFGWRKDGQQITGAHTTAGDLLADEFVLAGGSWSPGMLSGLGLRMPIQAGKGYSLTLDNPPLKLQKSLLCVERKVAVTPMGDKLRFGGTMEISGHSDNVRLERVQQIIAGARFYFPELKDSDFANVKPWFGYRPVSPDGLPYIGRFGRYKNLTTAAGHAMLGLTMAPISGLLIADIISGRKPRVDLSMLSPDRYA